MDTLRLNGFGWRFLTKALVLVLIAILSQLHSGSAYAQEEKPYVEKGTSKRCPHGKHACDIDKEVEDVQENIKHMTKDYETGEVWRLPPVGENKGKTKYGWKALKLAARAPSYAMRAITWPPALLSRFLIDKGVIETLINTFSNKERTFWVYPLIEFGFGYGFGVGVGVKHTDLFHKNYKLDFAYKIHIDLDQELGFSFGKPDALILSDRPLGYKITFGWKHYYAENFYGVGIGSSESNHAIYKNDLIRWGAELSYEPIDNLTITSELKFSTNWNASGEDGYPSVERVFPRSELPGFDSFVFYFIPVIEVKHDTRDAQAAPNSGGYRRLTLSRYQGLNTSAYDFNEYNLEVIQYFKLWLDRHVLALRTEWDFRHGADGVVPYFKMASFDVFSPARGFSGGRFHDNAMAVFNIEYRFPVWKYLDGEFFFDTGRVFNGFKDVSFKRFKYSGGTGLRLRTKNFFLCRLQVAYGGEGVKVLFKTSQAF
jgi:hypothetical protein